MSRLCDTCPVCAPSAEGVRRPACVCPADFWDVLGSLPTVARAADFEPHSVVLQRVVERDATCESHTGDLTLM